MKKEKTAHGKSPIFRRVFTLDKPIHAAKMKICGLGYYEAWINQK